jgi:hypothetical protein
MSGSTTNVSLPRPVRELTSKLHLRTAVNRDQARAAVVRISGQLADLAERAVSQAHAVLQSANGCRQGNRPGGRAATPSRRRAGRPDRTHWPHRLADPPPLRR